MTGFQGTATARAEYLDGSVKVLVEARHPTDLKERWIPECRVQPIEPIEATPVPGSYV